MTPLTHPYLVHTGTGLHPDCPFSTIEEANAAAERYKDENPSCEKTFVIYLEPKNID